MDITQDERKWMNLVPYITYTKTPLIKPISIHKICFPLSLHLIFLLCFEIDILTSFMLQSLETFPFVTLLVQFVRQYRVSFLIEFFNNINNVIGSCNKLSYSILSTAMVVVKFVFLINTQSEMYVKKIWK